MDNSKRYLGMVFGKHVDKIVPVIEKFVDKEKTVYQTFTVINSTVSFVSFFSKNKLSEIKNSIKAYSNKIDFMLFDISTQGENFDMECKGLEEYILLANVADQNFIEEKENPMDLDSLLELLNKNGWASLTEEQKLQLQNFSEG